MRRLALGLLAGAALLAAGCGSGDPSFEARFTNARGLVVGNDVRIGGAVAGRVQAVDLARDGSARVRFTSDVAPRADAVAAIRPVDLLGDTYLALSPGRAAAPLRAAIPLTRTANAPRLDELLAAFRPAVRDGLKALLVEAGVALDQRGDDLSRAAVALRPALEATTRVTAELGSQSAALATLVAAAERPATAVAARSGDVGPLLRDLDGTLAPTAAQSSALRAGTGGLPATLARVDRTTQRLARVADRARPPARALGAGATDLGGAVAGLPAFARRARRTAVAVLPLLRSARRLLVRGDGTFTELARVLGAARVQGPDIARLTAALAPAAQGIAQGFLTEFPDQAEEPGTQPFDPFADERRGYWRGAAVFSCEAFGLKVEPGCLQKAFPAPAARARDRKAATIPAATPKRPTTPAPKLPTVTAPKLPPQVQQPLDDVQRRVGASTKGLLDFLLGP